MTHGVAITYGAETWRLTKRLEIELRSSQRAMEKRMLGVMPRDKKTAAWIKFSLRYNNYVPTIKTFVPGFLHFYFLIADTYQLVFSKKIKP